MSAQIREVEQAGKEVKTKKELKTTEKGDLTMAATPIKAISKAIPKKNGGKSEKKKESQCLFWWTTKAGGRKSCIRTSLPGKNTCSRHELRKRAAEIAEQKAA